MERTLALKNLLQTLAENADGELPVGSRVWFIHSPRGNYIEAIYGTVIEAAHYAVTLKKFFLQGRMGTIADAKVRNVAEIGRIFHHQVLDFSHLEQCSLAGLRDMAKDLGYRYFATWEGKVIEISDNDTLLFTNAKLKTLPRRQS